MPVSLSNVHMHRLKLACKLYIWPFSVLLFCAQFFFFFNKMYFISQLSVVQVVARKRSSKWDVACRALGHLLI